MQRYRIIIPTLLQKEIFTKLHAAHQETEKQSSRLRQDKHSDRVFCHAELIYHLTVFVTFFKLVSFTFAINLLINNDLDMHIQAKTNDRKVRRFGDILAPLSRETKLKMRLRK